MARHAVVQNGVVVNVAEADLVRRGRWAGSRLGRPRSAGRWLGRPGRARRWPSKRQRRAAPRVGGLSLCAGNRRDHGRRADIDTDRPSQALVNGAYSYSLLNPSALIDWKTASGAWVRIDAATIAGIASAVAAHIPGLFQRRTRSCRGAGGAGSGGSGGRLRPEHGWGDRLERAERAAEILAVG